MGDIVSVQCSECGFQKNFFLGIGMSYYPDNVLDDSQDGLMRDIIPSKSLREKVNRLVSNGSELESDYQQALYKCSHCDRLTERFRFSLKNPDGTIFIPSYRCGECRHLLVEVELDSMEPAVCPLCEKKTYQLDSSLAGLWD